MRRSPGPGRPGLIVSNATAGFLTRGHPWVRPDRFTRGLERLRPGEVCDLLDQQGRRLGSALADPQSPVCARAVPDDFAPERLSIRAWERRAPLHADAGTNCYRIIHGEADGLPGLRVERFATCLVVTVTAACILPHLDAVLGTLGGLAGDPRIIIHEHLEDLRRSPLKTRGEATVVEGRELGVRYPLRPAEGLASGLYVDQRATRTWLRTRAPGARVLNLFAYTGAFSLSLLGSGAASALDVDLSAPSLARADEAARLNGFTGHRSLRSDCRAFLAGDTGTYDIIITDPPTAAQGGGGWVARRDYPELLRLAWARLAPGGILVASVNTLGKPFPLRETLAATCPDGKPVETPPLGLDIPQQRGFPEGRPYRLAAITRA